MKLLLSLCALSALGCLLVCPALRADSAPVKRGDVVYSWSFAKPEDAKQWDFASNTALSWDGNNPGGRAMKISLAPNGPKNAAAELKLDPARLRGLRLVVTVRVKATDVAKPPFPYNGIKAMTIVKSPGGTGYCQANNLYGTFDWKDVRYGLLVPRDATDVTLLLGIENTTGTAEISDIRMVVLEVPRPAADAVHVPRPAYTGHAVDRLRGAMIGTVDDAAMAKFADDWHANVVRYQLGGSRPGGPEADLTPAYQEFIDRKLNVLDAFLPIAKKHGIAVVVCMFAVPGGRISGGEGDRIFQDVRYQDQLAQAWDKISKRYAGNKTIWGYDLCNEPLERTTPDNVPGWQDLATRLARIVRQNDAGHAIIVESMNSDPDEFRYLRPIPVKDVVYSVHMYEPHAFTHQGVYDAWTPVSYPGKIAGEEWNKERLAAYLKPVIDFQHQYNVSILVGEFSAVRWAPGSIAYLRDLIDIYEANHWDWCYHAYREWPGWSAEYSADHDATSPSPTETERAALLKSYYVRNSGGR